MKLSHLFLIALAHLLVAAYAAETENPSTAAPTTKEAPTTKAATTQPPTTKAATTQPPTTKATTTNPPTTKATTTNPPTTKATTTNSPTTKATKTNSPTTEAPATNKTSTTQPPETKAPPTPPKPTFTASSYDFKTGDTCIRFVAALQLSFKYEVKDNSGKNATRHQNVTQNFENVKRFTTVSGVCPGLGKVNNTNASSLVISFNETYTLTFDFVLNTANNNNHWYINSTTVEIVMSKFPNAKNQDNVVLMNVANATSSDTQKVPLGSYLVCNATTDEILLSKDATAKLAMKDVMIEAFGDVAKGYSSSANRCDADYVTNNIVPIAVGCALAALVLVVLIAYLIGRSRNNKGGYQSV